MSITPLTQPAYSKLPYSDDDRKEVEQTFEMKLAALQKSCTEVHERIEKIVENLREELKDIEKHGPPSILWKAVPLILMKKKSEAERDQEEAYLQQKLKLCVEFQEMYSQTNCVNPITIDLGRALTRLNRYLRANTLFNVDANNKSVTNQFDGFRDTAFKIYSSVYRLFAEMDKFHKQLDKICAQKSPFFNRYNPERAFSYKSEGVRFSTKDYPQLQLALNDYLALHPEAPRLEFFKLEIPPQLSNHLRELLEPLIDKLQEEQRVQAKKFILGRA